MNKLMLIGTSWAALALSAAACGQSSCAGSMTEAPSAAAMADARHSQPAADIVDTAVAAGNFTTLAAALKAAGLVETLKGEGPFTVFAPTDQAFAKLPAGTLETLLKPENRQALTSILTYHVVPGSVSSTQVIGLKHATTVNGQRLAIAIDGGKVRLDGVANVIKTDIECKNGVIHVIDAVVLPVDMPIPGVAAKAGSFTTLLAAVKAAGLDEALSGKGPFTVFAPTDAAFQKLPAGTVENLLKPENKERLAAILKLHVVPGASYADQVATAPESGKTLQGRKLTIKTKDGKVMVVSGTTVATVTATDIEASNGVIHVIDTVLLPE